MFRIERESAVYDEFAGGAIGHDNADGVPYSSNAVHDEKFVMT